MEHPPTVQAELAAIWLRSFCSPTAPRKLDIKQAKVDYQLGCNSKVAKTSCSLLGAAQIQANFKIWRTQAKCFSSCSFSSLQCNLCHNKQMRFHQNHHWWKKFADIFHFQISFKNHKSNSYNLQVMLGSACVLEALGSDGTLDERKVERWEKCVLSSCQFLSSKLCHYSHTLSQKKEIRRADHLIGGLTNAALL